MYLDEKMLEKLNHSGRQKGLALIMVMLFLILLVGISIIAVRKSIFSEGMARNQLDLAAAREAAESALRDAERDIMYPRVATLSNASCARGVDELTANDFTGTCSQGLCYLNDSIYPATSWSTSNSSSSVKEVWWPDAKGGLWNNSFSAKPQRSSASLDSGHCSFTGGVPFGTFTGASALKGVIRQPEYIVEYFYRKNIRANIVETQVSSNGLNANKVSAMYRITARGFGYSSNTQIILQTVVFP